VNDRPIASDSIHYILPADGIHAFDLLSVASDIETAAADMVYTVNTSSMAGTLTDLGGGHFEYDPSGLVDSTTFRYRVTDTGDGEAPPKTSDWATVTLTENMLPRVEVFEIINTGRLLPWGSEGPAPGYRVGGCTDDDGDAVRWEIYAYSDDDGVLDVTKDALLRSSSHIPGPRSTTSSTLKRPSEIGWGVGQHVYFIRVQDDRGAWSVPVSAEVEVVDMVVIGSKSSGPWYAPKSESPSSRTIRDSDGTRATVSLSRYGVLGITLNDAGDIDSIIVAETTEQSNLTIKTDKGGDGEATIGHIVLQDGASFKSIRGSKVDLVGAGITGGAGSYVCSITLDDVLNSADISLAGTAPKGVTITAGCIQGGTDIVLGSGIKSLSATEYLGGSLIAPWAAKITTKGNKRAGIAGDFGADVLLSGVGAPKGISLKSAKIAGDLLAQTSWDMQAGLVGSLSFSGTVHQSVVRSAGNIKRLALGASDGSDFGAGVAMNLLKSSRHVDVGDVANAPQAMIGKFTVKGLKLPNHSPIPRLFVDSCISSGVGKATVRNWDGLGGLFAPQGEVGKIKLLDSFKPAPVYEDDFAHIV